MEKFSCLSGGFTSLTLLEGTQKQGQGKQMPSVTTDFDTLQSFFPFFQRVLLIIWVQWSSFLLSPPLNRFCSAKEIDVRKKIEQWGQKKNDQRKNVGMISALQLISDCMGEYATWNNKPAYWRSLEKLPKTFIWHFSDLQYQATWETTCINSCV